MYLLGIAYGIKSKTGVSNNVYIFHRINKHTKVNKVSMLVLLNSEIKEANILRKIS